LTGFGVLKNQASLGGDSEAPGGFEERVRRWLPVDVIFGTHHGVEEVCDLDGLESFLHDVPVTAACNREGLGAVVEARDFYNLLNRRNLLAELEENRLFVPHQGIHLEAQSVLLV
jgi:hypothetical protein